MLITTNITNSPDDTSRYRDSGDLRGFLDQFHLDGVELMPMGGDYDLYCIPRETVQGVHLPIQADWFDFWRGNEESLLREFGDLKTAEEFYGGTTPEVITDRLRKNLDFAQRLGAKYVVFHVSNVTIRETVSYRFVHTHEQVCQAAAEIVNSVLDGSNYGFDFLMENLWWPGLTFTCPEMTRDLANAVHYPKKGFMLDTGHLMHTDLTLKTQDEGIDYILRCLDAHGSLCDMICGVHLHQSVTRDAVRKMLEYGVPLSGNYWQDFGTVYRYILQIDRHRPFDTRSVGRLIESIHPSYLTHEFISDSRTVHESYLRTQSEALGFTA